jgi:translation initiation factor 2 alpha subunit (eIF-2alpha)
MVHSILQNVAATSGNSVESLYEAFVWDLYERFGHACDAFKVRVSV